MARKLTDAERIIWRTFHDIWIKTPGFDDAVAATARRLQIPAWRVAEIVSGC